MGFITDTLGITNKDPRVSSFDDIRKQGGSLQANIDETDYNAPLASAIGGLGQVGGGAQYDALTGALNAQMAGTGPSVAQNQLNETTGANVNRANAMAASQKGINPALAAKMGIDASAMANQQAAGQAATLRAGEQIGARGELANVLNQQAQQKNQNLATLGGLLGNQSANKIANAGMAQGISANVSNANTQQAAANDASRTQMIGGLAQAGGTIAAGGFGKKAHGGLIEGDHPQNDVVPAMLSPGEIVLPRSIVQSPDAAERAKAFVEAIKKSSKGKR